MQVKNGKRTDLDHFNHIFCYCAYNVCRLIHILLCDRITFQHITAGDVVFPRLDRVIDRQRICSTSPDITRDSAGKFDKYVVLRAFRLLLDMHLPVLRDSGCSYKKDVANVLNGESKLHELLPLSLSESTRDSMSSSMRHYDSAILMYLSEMMVWDILVQQFISLPFVVQQEMALEDFGREHVWEPFLALKIPRSPKPAGDIVERNEDVVSVMSQVTALVFMGDDKVIGKEEKSGLVGGSCDWCGGQEVREGLSLSRCSRCTSVQYCRYLRTYRLMIFN
jgi:hypothetical protein